MVKFHLNQFFSVFLSILTKLQSFTSLKCMIHQNSAYFEGKTAEEWLRTNCVQPVPFFHYFFLLPYFFLLKVSGFDLQKKLSLCDWNWCYLHEVKMRRNQFHALGMFSLFEGRCILRNAIQKKPHVNSFDLKVVLPKTNELCAHISRLFEQSLHFIAQIIPPLLPSGKCSQEIRATS